MFEKIFVNMIRSQEISGFKCYKIPFNLNDTPTEDHKNLVKKIHRFSRSKFPCYPFGNHIYLAGDSHILTNFIYTFEKAFETSLNSDSIYEIGLELSNPTHQRIITSLLYRHFEDLLRNRSFVKPRKGNIALPLRKVQERIDFSLINEEKFYESFYYKFEIINNRIYLVIEPKITILIPYNNYKEDDWVIPNCFNYDCELYQQCNIIPTNSVKFKQLKDFSGNRCGLIASGGASVYDPKKDQEIVIPKKVLFQEPRFSEIPFQQIRRYSVIDPDRRKTYTERFFKLIFEETNFIFRIGKNDISFSRELVNLDYNDGKICRSLVDGYHYVNEIPDIFGEGLQHTSAYTGLRNHGTYSSNKRSEPKYGHPSTIRIFSIYPLSLKGLMDAFLGKLKNGYGQYPGFSETSTPFRSELLIQEYPLDVQDETSFISKTENRVTNLLGEYPRHNNDLFLFAIPDNYEKFYYQIKDFCFSRKIRNQVIRRANLTMNWYPLFNFSLSVYAKAGGTPWNLDSSNFSVADCYLGMKFARKTVDRFGPGEFFVGAVDVFNAYGEHISFALHQGAVLEPTKGLHVDKAFMKNLILRAVERYEDKIGSLPRRLLIYRPESFHYQETEAVKEVLSEMDIPIFYLIHVQHNTRLRAYDPTIRLQIRRGTYFVLKEKRIILFPTGRLEIENKDQELGTPKAVQLNIRKMEQSNEDANLSCEEIYEICRNYLAFTKLRWNSLGSRIRETLPVFASSKVADGLKRGYKGLEGIDIRDIL